MNGETSEYAPIPEPAPAPKPLKTCARCGMAYKGPISAHRAASPRQGGCIPLPPDDPSSIAVAIHGEEVIAAVHAEAQNPETDDQ